MRRPRVHRILGRITGAVVLLALLPSGAWLAIYAKGGMPGTLGFLLSAGILGIATVQGILKARARAYAAHRRCMLQVIGQMSVAVTSRALLAGFDRAGVEPQFAYIVALWLPVLASALLAALIGSDRRRHHATQPGGLALSPAR